MKSLSSAHEFLIIANGEFITKEIITEAAQDKFVLALDGAANKLLALDIYPDLILGDLDSLHPDIKQSQSIPIEMIPDQNTSDLMKGIQYCDQHNAKEISVICATGGRMDHHENVLRALRKYYRQHRPIIVHTEQQSIRFAKNESVNMNGVVGDMCGILAYPEGSCTTRGLTYDMTNHPLQFAQSESICNSLAMTQAEIHISGEALLIMPPMYQSQREYMQLSRVEQLSRLARDAAIYHR